MIPVDEFYDKSREEKQRIVDNGQVVVNGEVADTIPPTDTRGGIYVFDNPVTDLVVDQLKGAQYTASEIQPEFPIDKQELDDLFGWMKYEPLELLVDHFGVLRVVDTEGASYVYTVEVVPFEARCIDPTLSGYLLDANDRCPISRPQISSKQDMRANNEYVEYATEYWDIPEAELTIHIDDDNQYATSTLGPLPVVNDLPNTDSVIERFQSTADSYRRKRHDVRNVKKNISFHKSRCRRNPSLGSFQSFALYLFDLNEYATIENNSELRELVIQGGEILYRCLYVSLIHTMAKIDLEVSETQTTRRDSGVVADSSDAGESTSEKAESGSNTSKRNQQYSKRELIDAIESLANQLGYVPSTNDMDREGPVNPGTIRDRFGSWDDALDKADLSEIDSRNPEEVKRDTATDEEVDRMDLLMDLLGIKQDIGRPPKKEDVKPQSSYTVDQYVAEFGSWDAVEDVFD